MISAADKTQLDHDGVIVVRGAFTPWVERLQQATESVLLNPGPLGKNSALPNATGRFFQERQLWKYQADFQAFITESSIGELSAACMGSNKALLYSDHLFVKEPNTSIPTPWHQDYSYFTIDGWQQCSIWLALDQVDADSGGLEFVRGSHRWETVFGAADFSGRGGKFPNENMQPVPDIEARRAEFDILSFELAPGDCLIFHHRTLHGARSNSSPRRRRAFSTRWAGDDVVYRPTSNGAGPADLIPGQSIESKWYPCIWRKN